MNNIQFTFQKKKRKVNTLETVNNVDFNCTI